MLEEWWSENKDKNMRIGRSLGCDFESFAIAINFHKTFPFDLVSLAFLCYFLFWEEKDIKFEQKYLFIPDFNRGGLRKTNRTYLRWVK